MPITSAKAKADKMTKDAEVFTHQFKEIVKELKSDLNRCSDNDILHQVTKRTMSFYFAKNFEPYSDDFNGKISIYTGGEKNVSYIQSHPGTNVGFVCRLIDVRTAIGGRNHLSDTWLYHCKENRYRESFEEFKKLPDLKILEVYCMFLNREQNGNYQYEVITEKYLEIHDIVILFSQKHFEKPYGF